MAAVDRLGGEGVAHLVRVDVPDPGGLGGLVQVAGDGVAVHRLAVLPGQQQRVARGHVALAVVGDQGHQLRVQRDVAVVVQLADRDVQPVPGADLHDRVVLEGDQLADPQAGPDEDFADDADE